ncbi:ribonuclease HI [Umezakia ovalisporum]|uniref:Ribonuclease H n=2 Tax=Umezakia ovalisporum TaxID=75695 RepID=A0AA43GZP8_9CYAN|nr:ribonuclease HI [Umezakia ovalisporum]MBI1242717.1 ribonuclease HI [Nostoc sp. RI_552]MDH6058400.1 ribonuclease HI [Umezakia ovalisporum FSS-43]MDH6064187.1 ribonuclease HI [Umezakia ovalisporum FSS-62]MDH6066351.1 ribonuclease HI [Umezakia ovalisporum APH033B]MDH6070506.1 ribonuclease HI [Umezakia ovalisporum CobakiLakeA]
MSNQRKIQSIYTDGACTGNPGPGGWGVVAFFSDGEIHEMGGAVSHTTNNKMEMEAAIAALKFFHASAQAESITLYTDSEYLINCVTKWLPGWKKRSWKKADGKPVQNQELLEILDQLNTGKINWQHVRGHSGNIGNERCDVIARSFASGQVPCLQELCFIDSYKSLHSSGEANVENIADYECNSTILNESTEYNSTFISDVNVMEPSTAPSAAANEETQSTTRVKQLSNLLETLRIAEEISEKGYLITSSELADLMDVHASAVTSRGDQWRWRNWIVSRVRREGNQILWELERGDRLETEDES